MNNRSNLQITPKQLGLIATSSYCPRCFKYKLSMRFKSPFNHFGGAIFTYMEQTQMAVIGHLLEQDGCLPKEFHPFEDITGRVPFPRSWIKFQYRMKSGVLLYGVPDEIFRLEDGSNAIIDLKTAHRQRKAKKELVNDPLLPCYEIQGIGYGLIAEKGLGLGETSRGGIFYWASQHQQVLSNPSTYYRGGRLSVPFVPQIHEYAMDYSILDSPLKEAMKLWKASVPPARSKDCKDCLLLDALMQIEQDFQKILEKADRRIIDYLGSSPNEMQQVLWRRTSERSIRQEALSILMEMAPADGFAVDGIIANWDSIECMPESVE